ncbi:MAG: hypothetical protein IKB86_05595 [Clostridia bacterium]|nr:hypothetical protein [Clostridia bacterium]
MKYAFLFLIAYGIIELFVLKRVQNKIAFCFLCVSGILAGAANLLFEFSFFDLIKGVLQ